MNRQPAISAESLSCTLGGRLILDSVSLSLSRGGRITLIGPNGAGKTTLLKCLMRIIGKDSGTVRVDGTDTSSMKQKELSAAVSYVPQADSRYLPFTVEEFVMTGRYPHLSPFTACSELDRAAVRDALESTGMNGFESRRMSGLSGGEKQLVMIAASLAQGAGIMLLDEPAAFLDPGHEQRLMGLLRSINIERGTSILMVTHDINRAILGGGSTLVLNKGRVEYFGCSSELPRSGVLENVYGRRFEYMRHPEAGCDIVLPDVKYHESKR